MRAELEKDPKMKETLDELRNSKMGGKTIQEAAEDFNKRTEEAKSRLSQSASETAEEARKRLKDGEEAFAKTSEQAKEAGQTLGSFFEDLKGEFGLKSDRGGGDAKKDAGDEQQKPSSSAAAGADDAKGEETKGEGPAATPLSRFSELRKRLLAQLPESFASDDRSWDEAFKAVFGIRPKKKSKAGAAGGGQAADAAKGDEEGLEEWFEAIDKESGDVYYYNTAGETVWEKPTNAKIIKAPEHEAQDWANAEPEKSIFEIQIEEKVAEISQLEEERDAAMADSNMAKFKELNNKIRGLRKDIEKISMQANTTAVVHVEEKKGAWDQFNENLREAPILKSIFGLADSEAVKKARDAAEDAREAIETSQNPLVYRMYSVYDSMRMDPEFTIEGFVEEMQYDLAPTVIKGFLRGDLKLIDNYCSEGAGAAVKASIKDRQAARRKMDENILSIGEMHVAAAKVVDKMGPLIVLQFMVQQINCMYDLKGNVVEGKEDEIVGVFYIFAMTMEYNEEEAEMQWKIKEFAIGGTTPWI
ncbi:Mitochondrial import inner membrane translocase subunit TIM44-1 [Durusdinium trenchii]|uniref:Mitochondrial import inner membrane translocase subunit TIM44-1 n=1 Tax=Durusdinium trenchii TaxID=1381693 RepID=A0ABP0KGT8_9DINO